MKKQLTVFIISLFSLIIGGYFFFYSTDDNLSEEDARNFGIKEINRIDKIFLADKKGTQVILTKENDVWRVNGNYVARKIRIQTLLKTAQKIKVKQRVPTVRKEIILKNLAAKHIKVEFFSEGELLKSYLVGSADGSTTGTYMLLIDEETGSKHSTPFLTHLIGFEGYLTPRYEPHPNTWRDLKIFFFPKNTIQSVKLNYPSHPENNFEIKFEKSSYALFQKNRKLDFEPIAIKKYLINFKSIAAENIIAGKVKDIVQKKIRSQTVWFSLSVTDFSGKTSRIIGYQKKMASGSTNAIGLPLYFDPDRFYGICFENELTTLQHFVFEPLLIKKSDLQ